MFISLLNLIAVYQLATTAIYARKECERRFHYVNSLCVYCALCGALNCALVFVVTVLAGHGGSCKFLKISSVVCATLSRCLSNFFFYSRFKSLYRNSSAIHEISWTKYFILDLSIFQVFHFLCVCATVSDDVFTSKHFPLVQRVVFIAVFCTIFLLQTVLLSLSIKLLYHHIRYGVETSSGKVLMRVCISTVIFIASDLFVVVVAVFSPDIRTLSLEIYFSFSLVINTAALQCSFANHKRRLLPYLKPKLVHVESIEI